jgi:hypothetical protein
VVEPGNAVGVTVETVRTRVLQSEVVADFAAWCALVDGGFRTTQAACEALAVTTPTPLWAALAQQCVNASLLALLDPDTLIHPTTLVRLLPAGRDRVYYATLAKYAALALRRHLWDGSGHATAAWSEGNSYQDWDSADEGGLKTFPLAIAYDWTMAAAPEVWSDADRVTLAEAAIRAAYGAAPEIKPSTGPAAVVGPFYGINDNTALGSRTGNWGAYGVLLGEALLLEADRIAGTAGVGWTAGRAYADEIRILSQRFRAIHAAIVAQATFYLETGLWPEGEYYGRQAISGFWGHVAAYRTVIQDDVFAPGSFFAGYVEAYLRFAIRPQYFTIDPHRQRPHVWRWGSGSEATVDARNFTFGAIADPALGRWAQQQYLEYPDGYALQSADHKRAYWWFTRWVMGCEHVPATPPQYPLCGQVGNRLYAWRTGRSLSDTQQALIAIWGWGHRNSGGHTDLSTGQITLFCGGVLLPGVGWGDKTGPSSQDYGTLVTPNCPIPASAIRLYSAASESDGVTYLQGSHVSTSSLPNPDPARLGDDYAIGQVTEVWASQTYQPRAAALKLDTTHSWSSALVATAARSLAYCQPLAGSGLQHYLVVCDEITLVASAATARVLQLWQFGITDNQDVVPGKTWPHHVAGTLTRVAHGTSWRTRDGDLVTASGGSDDFSHGEWTSTDARRWRWRNPLDGSTGAAALTIVEPTTATMHLLGGSAYWYLRDLDPTRRRIMAATADVLAGRGSSLSDAAANWYGRWRLEVRSTPGTTVRRFLTVLQFTPDATTLLTPAAVSRMETPGGEYVGVRIEDSEEIPRVVLFRVGSLPSTISYDVGDALPLRHLITGLPPGSSWVADRVGTTIQVVRVGIPTDLVADAGGCLEVTR